MREKQIYLVLTDTGTIFTRIIKSYTRAPYNHVSVAFDAGLTEVYSFGRKHPRNPFRAGFVKEDIQSILFQRATCAVYSLTVTRVQYQQMKCFIKEMYVQRENYRYHLLGLLGVVLNRPLEKENAFFCSQFVATVFKECGICQFEKEVALVKPADLPVAGAFQLIYTGKLANYTNGIQGKVHAPHHLYPRVGM